MRRSPLTVVYLTVFIDLLGFGIILPLLPLYAEDLGASGIWVGGILSAYSGMQFFASPIFGRISDRMGRRPVILTSLLCACVGFIVTGLSSSLPVLLAGRAVAGLGGGSIGSAQAYIADTTSPKDRTKAMGMLGASIGLGFILGPALGGGLSGFGFGTASFVAAGLAGGNFLLGIFILKEPQKREGARPLQRPTFASLANAFKRPAMRRILLSIFLSTFAFAAMESTFALLGKKRYGLDERDLGLLFAGAGALIVIIQGGLVGRISSRYGERRMAIIGCVLLAGGLLLLPLAPNLGVAMLFLGGIAAGQGLISPGMFSMLSLSSDGNEQGGMLGLGQSHAAAARAVGPIIAGLLYDVYDGLPYLLAGCLVIIVAIVISGLDQRVPARKQAAETT